MKRIIRVVGCIMQHEDKILILHRSTVEVDPSLWGIPAGKVEKDETDLHAATREIYEETSIKLSEEELEYLGHLPVEYEEFTVDFQVFYTSFDKRPTVSLTPQEHTDSRWVRPSEIIEMMDLMKDVEIIIQKFCIEKLGIN